MRTRRRLAAALLLAGALVLLAPTAATAHASLVSIDPVPDWVYESPPAEVALTFSEPVTVDLGGIRVFGPDGERVDSETVLRDAGTTVAAEIDAAAHGTYTVAWSVVSADSHVLSSTFVFHVGARTGSGIDTHGSDPQVLVVIGWLSRWALLSGVIALGGLVLYRLGAAFPLAGSRAHAVAIVAGVLMLGGALGRMTVQATAAAGLPFAEVAGLGLGPILATRAGTLDGIRVLAAAAALVCAVLWHSRIATAVAGVGVLTAMVTLALLGHAWTADPAPLAVAVDVVHQLAVTAWVGGLISLVVLSDRSQLDDAMRRFSRIALIALILVVVSGTASALWQTSADPTTLTTGYGILLLTKIGLVAVMVVLGWWQRRRLADAAQAAARMLTTTRAEIAVAIGVVAVTAALVGTVPAREALAPGPYVAQVEEDLGTVSVAVEPGLVGDSVVTLTFADRVGSPRAVDVATLTVSQGDLPPRAVTLTVLAPDRWAAIDVSLPTPGEWLFDLTTLSRGQQSSVTFPVEIREAEDPG